jgi:hypothetical protein
MSSMPLDFGKSSNVSAIVFAPAGDVERCDVARWGETAHGSRSDTKIAKVTKITKTK